MFFRKAPRWLVVFLGNPGVKYAGTRHNVGFMTADFIEKSENVKINRLKYRALTTVCELSGNSVMLMKPQTYMNLSGEAVKPAADYYKIPLQNIIVIADDVTLKPGKIRIRRKGSAGGHNGLKNIAEKLGSDEFPRIKIGVGSPDHPDYDMADFVLGKPRGNDMAEIAAATRSAAEAVKIIIGDGIDSAMNKYN